MDQHTSLLFRLPRELRDEIYTYYVWEERGYIFEPRSAKLRTTGGRPINLALGYACKRTAEEMDGLALQVNKINFLTMLDVPDFVDQCTNTALYEHFLKGRATCLRRMLSWGHTLVSPDTMQVLRSRYPENLAVKTMEESIIEYGNDTLDDGYLPLCNTLDYSAHESILQGLVQILASHPDFGYLTSKDYRPDLRETIVAEDDDDDNDDEEELEMANRPPRYTEETRQQIVQWEPVHWWIPNRNDLLTVAQFIPVRPEPSTYNRFGREQRTKYYFSAAAVAIRFLERLNPKTCMHLRKLVVHEDHQSVAMPRTHARGFIPFCRANPKLRVERRVDIWRTELVQASPKFGRNDDTRFLIADIARWIQEAGCLRQMGMPNDSFTLVLHGPSRLANQQLSDGMMQAAIWHEGAVEIARREKTDFYYFRHGVAEDFVEVIKKMLKGEIPARFDADMGEPWDIEEILRNHEGEWPIEIKEVFALSYFEEPYGGWAAAREEYLEEVDWANRMDGWDRLVR